MTNGIESKAIDRLVQNGSGYVRLDQARIIIQVWDMRLYSRIDLGASFGYMIVVNVADRSS